MKRCIFFDVSEPVMGVQKLSRTSCALTQLGNQSGCQLSDADRIDFECFAEVVEISDFFRGKTPQVSCEFAATERNYHRAKSFDCPTALRGLTSPLRRPLAFTHIRLRSAR
jgi:endonuclease III-like uncharacterized protein